MYYDFVIVLGVLSSYVLLFIFMAIFIYICTWLPTFREFFHKDDDSNDDYR
ncbi:hypothetical protein [Wukongibacter baidiensis]